MLRRHTIQDGEEFEVLLKKGNRSKTLSIPDLDIESHECAGKSLGVFAATKIHRDYVEAEGRIFNARWFQFRKTTKNNLDEQDKPT